MANLNIKLVLVLFLSSLTTFSPLESRFMTDKLFKNNINEAFFFNNFVETDLEEKTEKVQHSHTQTENFNLLNAVFSHFHNKLVHFPVALLVVAFVLSLVQLRWDKFIFTIQVLVLLGFVFAIPTLITGIFQEELVENATNESFIEIHEYLAFATTLASAIWFLFVSKEKLRKYHLVPAIITFILILATGMLGGIIAH
ncbi:MAG: DUF2231 domain-containing protein [Candidatus Kapaibacteriota bacterium]